jgi:hypothetical protein
MPTGSNSSWTARVWREFHVGNLTRAFRDVLLTLKTYRGRGGLICPSHETLAQRVGCHASTVWRALRAARVLGLVQWTERRVRAVWRSLRTSNRYWLLQPEEPVAPRPRTTVQRAGGGENTKKKEASGSSVAAVNAMIQAAKGLPDLLLARRTAWETGQVARRSVG